MQDCTETVLSYGFLHYSCLINPAFTPVNCYQGPLKNTSCSFTADTCRKCNIRDRLCTINAALSFILPSVEQSVFLKGLTVLSHCGFIRGGCRLTGHGQGVTLLLPISRFSAPLAVLCKSFFRKHSKKTPTKCLVTENSRSMTCYVANSLTLAGKDSHCRPGTVRERLASCEAGWWSQWLCSLPGQCPTTQVPPPKPWTPARLGSQPSQNSTGHLS